MLHPDMLRGDTRFLFMLKLQKPFHSPRKHRLSQRMSKDNEPDAVLVILRKVNGLNCKNSNVQTVIERVR